MKKIFLAGLIFCAATSFAKISVINMNEVRLLYQKAVGDEKACKELIALLAPYDEKNNALLSGYKASVTMIMAKHVFNPFTKLSYFKKGKKMLERAIAADKKNIELRFLRFAAQTNMPSFLGYDSSIDDDKNFILGAYSHVADMKLKEFIFPVLNKSKYITAGEKLQLKK